ncbi:MAG: MEDS domain-containing protein [Candidatus Limnocylindria bacterium]
MGFREIEQVRSIAGRPRPTEHIVHFYEQEQYFLGELVSYIVDGLSAGEATIMIATAPHRAEVERLIASRGIDLEAARLDGCYTAADASDVLALFMDASRPDPQRFEAVIEELIGRAAGPDGKRPVRAFGEMVAVLCEDGRFEAALELEGLWSVAARRLSFSLLCAYPVGTFKEERPGSSLSQTAASHDTVIRSGRRAPLVTELKEPLD